MNRTLATILAVLLGLSLLAGCGDKAPASSSSVPSSSSSSVPEPPPSSSSEAYTPGLVTETAYSNEFWDLAFTAPSEEVIMASNEQIEELLGLGAQQIGASSDTVTSALAVVKTCEMMAMDMKTGSNLTVLTSELPLGGITAEMIIKAGMAAMELAAPTMTLTPIDDGAMTDVTIAGKSYKMVGLAMAGEGMPSVTQQLYVHIDGKRALMITAGYSPDMKGAKESAQAMLDALTTAEAVPEPDEAAPEAKSQAAE